MKPDTGTQSEGNAPIEQFRLPLAGKAALVTGGGRGIGRAIALVLADAGADVAVVARTAKEIEVTAADIRATGHRSLAISADVCDAAQVARMVHETLSYFQRIDILVNNVGGRTPSPLLEMSEEIWDEAIRQNLTSCFLCSREVGKVMAQQRSGSIINISSEAAFANDHNVGHYAAAKAAVNHLTRSFAVELAPLNIRVNAIAPGNVDVGPNLERYSRDPERLELRTKMIPMGRFGKVQEIASASVFLASDSSSYITGAVLPVNGGGRQSVAKSRSKS